MEMNKNTNYFSIHPPKLEDAGLEDPALPIEGIQEAFRRVADLAKPKTGLSVSLASPSDGGMDDSVVDPSPELEEECESCVDRVIDGITPHEDVIVNSPDQLKEDVLLEEKDVGPELGKERCVVGENDPTQDSQATF